MLKLSCDIEYLIVNKTSCPEYHQVEEQRKALERTEVLLRHNKELEKKIDHLAHQLKALMVEKKNTQEEYSQKYIIMK
jgi:hypothetical protein